MRRIIGVVLIAAAGCTVCLSQSAQDNLAKALTFHASFDKGTDADFALGDRRIYTATSYKKREDAQVGIGNPDVSIVPGQGRYGAALQFRKKNAKAIYYQAEKNVAFRNQNWDGTISFWLSLDPDKDLEPGYCDPIQATDKDYNDSALWVDFTKDDKPRHFRLGVFGALKVWNPKDVPPDKNPDFIRRLVAVTQPPFGRGKWTHVVITHTGLNSKDRPGVARLYLNGRLQGKTEDIREPFVWDLSRAALRLGLSYVGLFDELTVFSRALSDQEVETLYSLKSGAASLHH